MIPDPEEFPGRTAQALALYAKASPEGREMLKAMHAHYVGILERFDGPGIPPQSVAATLHMKTDAMVRATLRTPGSSRPSCRKGCDSCCHLSVRVTRQEAVTLRRYMRDRSMTIHEARLERQAETGDDLDAFAALPVADRRCVFLADGSCRVYDVRPMACRKYMVKTDPQLCDTVRHPGARVGILMSYEAEIFYSAALTALDTMTMAQALIATRAEQYPGHATTAPAGE